MSQKRSLALEALKVMVLLLVFASTGYSGFSDSDWPMPYHDLEHSSFSVASSDIDFDEIKLVGSYNATGDILSPVAADINGDGKAEVVFSTKDKKIHALTYDLEVLWSRQLECMPTPVGVFDLEADGKYEIIYGCSDGAVYTLNPKGDLIWKYQTTGGITSMPAAGNLNYDNKLEVVFTSKDKNLYILDYQGKKLKDYNLMDLEYATPAIGDINADKENEVIISSVDNKLSVYSYSSPETWIYDAGGAVYGASVVGLDRTKYRRLVFGSGSGSFYSLYYTKYQTGSRIKCVEADCVPEPIFSSKLVPDWVFDNGYEEFYPPAVADLTGDEEPDYVAGTTGKNLYLIDNNGSVIRKHSVNAKIVSTPAIADLDEDDLPEIVFASADGIVQITNASGYKIWEYRGKTPIMESPALADLERDDKLEILVAAGNTLLVFGEEGEIEETTTTMLLIKTTTTTTAASTTTTTLTTTTTTATTTTTVITTTTTMPETKISDINIMGLPVYTILVLVIGLFFLLQVTLLIVVFTLPSIIQRRIDRLREEIRGYKKDLSSLEKGSCTKNGNNPLENKSGNQNDLSSLEKAGEDKKN